MADVEEVASSPENGGGEGETSVVTEADLGRRVVFFSSQDKREKYGTLRYYGRPEFASGVWCGVELDRPEGKNNGSKHGIRYFTCEPCYGVFVPVERVQRDSSRRSRSRPRSRPSSRPNSRPSSADRGRKGVDANEGFRVKPAVVQQELARLVKHAPVTDHVPRRKTGANSATASRQPMKAFARTKDDATVGGKLSVVPHARVPERGMQRAASSENLRGVKESSSKPVKKSSSEQNLKGGKTLPRTLKPSRRQSRPQSVSGSGTNGQQGGLDGVVLSSSSSSSSSPDGNPPGNIGFVTSSIGYQPISGLSTHASQFAEQERHSSGMCGVPLPQFNGGQSKGKLGPNIGTVSHPLSHVAGLKTDVTLRTIMPLLEELLDQNQKLMHRQGKATLPAGIELCSCVLCRRAGAKTGSQWPAVVC
jgi:hypothetical protein